MSRAVKGLSDREDLMDHYVMDKVKLLTPALFSAWQVVLGESYEGEPVW